MPAEFVGDFFGFLISAVCNVDSFNVLFCKGFCDQDSYFSCTYHKHGFSCEPPENVFGKVNSRRAYRDRTFIDPGLIPDPFSYLNGFFKSSIKDLACSSGFFRIGIEILYLAEDLVFSLQSWIRAPLKA